MRMERDLLSLDDNDTHRVYLTTSPSVSDNDVESLVGKHTFNVVCSRFPRILTV